ncbi:MULTISPECIES: hypothetical protein [unclassified Pseudonocardia]|uniref:hypothetical protein n=1 Tax=unclassified Pseudonocardia TaxID=2619320 RepID=UPI001AD508CE|nr:MULTISPECIES: hypothetical protein [unclassified Pseudonocardia]MBN9098043.1 hypothetical protein [Pseudonocardia sp.]
MSGTEARAVARVVRDRATEAEDAVAAGLGFVMVSSVHLDGWAHVNRPGLDTFFTPWHGVLYASFALYALFVGLMAGRRARRGEGLALSVPSGYAAALGGIGLFVAGGIGDLGWHQAFGVEAGIDALVSPTHLVLLAGGMLMVTAPARSMVLRGSPLTGAGRLALALSVGASAALIGFFVSYLSVFVDPRAVQPLTSFPEGTAAHEAAELPAIVGLGGYLLITAAILGPVLGLSRALRTVPGGVSTVAVASVALLGAGLSGYRYLVPALAAVLAVAVAEVVRWRMPGMPRRWLWWGGGLPVAVWTGQMGGLAVTDGIGWSAELWAGVLVLTALGGVAVALLSEPGRPAAQP